MTETEKIQKKESRKVGYMKPRQNLCLILQHSTIVPFRFYQKQFTCFYCDEQRGDFVQLKSHMTGEHKKMNFNSILKRLTNPQCLIKADVSDIACKICKRKIDDLQNFATHLTEEHNIKFNENDPKNPANRILPCDLSNDEFKCYICKSEFKFFKTLSSHMKTHNSDNVCEICGSCFLLPEELKAHSSSHRSKQASKCGVCDKICVSKVALRRHIRYSHKINDYACRICDIKFPNDTLKVEHLEEAHKNTLNLTCKMCLKKYDTPKGLNSHMEAKHFKKQKSVDYEFSCKECSKKYLSPQELTYHVMVHAIEKYFECEFCHEKYTKATDGLRAEISKEHLKTHRTDRRWMCGACSMAFVKKSSLKNHIRTQHTKMDCEPLILCKKPIIN